MEKALKLYTYVDGINDAPFPSLEEQVEINSFTYDAKRMGGAPNITFTVKHRLCLDNIWTNEVYALFNHERYYLRQIPTSVFDSTDNRYRHDVTLSSERIVLENVYFFDVVSSNTDNDKPVSNSSNVVFFGDIHEFASRLNNSLRYSHLDYSVVVDEGVSSDAKLMSFNDQFFANVLQEVYNTYEIPYYFVGKKIHIGNDENEMDQVFEYGVTNSLISISKENANYKIVNRCTGDGSSDNIPYYYPNPSPYGRLNVLYNNELSDNITITDWSKFSAYGPASVLKYEVTENETESKSIATLEDFKTHEVVQTSVLLDQPIYTWVGKYSMKIDDAKSKVYISFGAKVGYGGFITYSIKDDNGVKIAYGMFPNINGLELGYGSYDVYINISVGNRKDTAEEYARGIAEVNISRSSFKYLEGWRLNDKRLINLSSMGITMLGTPQVNDIISFEIAEERVPIVGKLMPSLYRETKGSDRFYNALNNTYINPADKPNTYVFTNPYIDSNPREHIVHFEDIKPTIKGITNASGERIDMFVDFAYDLNDNDEIDENGKYEHPYFYAKLRKFDGKHGFNLFAHAIEGNPMTIAMTSGTCGACQWTIGVDDKSNRNVVQVYEEDTTDADGVFHKAGTLKRNDNGDVLRSGVAQDIQNDTRSNEVWIALKKEESTFGAIMPKATVFSKEGKQIEAGYRPKPCYEGHNDGDTFVILHISLPESYILAAEQRLTEAIIKYMSENNDDKFNFSIKFSRIFLEQNQHILESLNENSLIKIKYNDNVYPLHVSSYSYKMTDNAPLPEIIVQLSDTITVNRSAVQNTLNEIKNANYRASYVSENGASTQTSVGLTSVAQASKNVVEPTIIELGLTDFVRKQGVDNISDVKIFHDEVILNNGVHSGDFSRGGLIGSGWGIYKDEYGRTVAEIDKIVARHVLELNDLKINQSTYEKGAQILSSGGCVAEIVEEHSDYYRCYFDNKQGSFFSGFVVGDIARCQRFDESCANIVKDYRRVVVGVSSSYVDLSKSEVYGDGVPSNGDTIIHFGNTIDQNRQYIIIRDVIGGGYERMLSDLNSVSATGVEYYFAGRMDGDTPRWFVGNKSQQFIEYKDGRLQIKADVTIGANSDLSASEEFQEVKQTANQAKQVAQNAEASAKSYADELVKDLQNQLDGKVESFFYDYKPTLSNLPASEWTTDELKKEHLNDTFTNTESGQSWRWLFKDGSYQWVEIADTQSAEALAKAQEALGVANGKVAVFVTEPRTPYNAKDLWLQGEDGRIKRCTFTRTTTGEFYAEDWVNADDSHEYTDGEIAKYKKSVDATIESLDNAIEAAEKASKDYTDEGKKALQASIDALNKAKANATDVYDKATADGLINQAEADAIAAAQELANAAQALAEETAKAYADGVVDTEEKARIKQAEENLNTAKKYAEDKAEEAENNAKAEIGTFDYLKQAIAQNTSVSGGLVQTALIQLGYRNGETLVVQSGTNGIYNSALKGGGIASWWGGDMLDKEVEGVTGRVAQALLRMDGTGYLAGGNITWDLYGAGSVAGGNLSWDKDGNITLSDNIRISSDKDETLGTVLTSISKLQSSLTSFKSLFDSMFEKDSDGNIHAKLSLWSSGGITAGGVGSGGSGGGGGISYNRLDSWADYSADKAGYVLSALLGKDLDNRVSALANAGYVTASALAPYALRSEIPSLDGYFLASNFNQANIKTTLGISDWALASVKPTYTASEVGALAQDSSGANADLDTILDSRTAVLKPFFQNLTNNNVGSARKGVLRMSYNGSESQLLFDHYNRLLRYRTIGENPKDWATLAFASDIPTKLSQLTDDVVAGKYLPLRGGTLSGSNRDLLNLDTLNTSGPRITLHENGNLIALIGCVPKQTTTDYGAYFVNVSSKFGVILGNDKKAYITLNTDTMSKDYQILHSGNYTDYALSKNGGTVSGTLSVSSILRFSDTDGTYKILLQRDSSGNILFGGGFATNNMYIDADVLRIRANRTIFSRNVTAPSFIGNLTGNADSASCVTGTANYANVALGENKVRLISNQTGNVGDFPRSWVSGLSVMSNYVGWQMVSYAGVDANPYFRKIADTGTWSEWKQIAFTDSNVASATKLQTPRTIWGQYFDGTQNVEGNLTNVNRIRFSEAGAQIFVRGSNYSSGMTDNDIGIFATMTAFSGNVAIGGTTANEKLHVYGNGKFTGSITAPSFIGNLTGNASAQYISYSNRDVNLWDIDDSTARYFALGDTAQNTPSGVYALGSILMEYSWDANAGAQLLSHNRGNNIFYRSRWNGAFKDWREIAFTDSNVASATKLATPRTIWGQPFDGTGDITGPLHLGNNISLRSYSTSGSKISTLILDPSNTLLLGYDMSNIGGTVLYGKALAMRYGTSRTIGFLLNEYGNVAIGGATADTKLHVYGDGKFEGSVTASSLTIGGATITYDSVNEALCINGNMYALGGITAGGTGISTYSSLEARVARLEQQLNI